MTPEQRILRARLGGLTTSALGHVNTESARRAFLDRFYDGIPEGVPAAERDRRASAARRLHFARLALRSSQVRGKKTAGAASGTPAPARSTEGARDAASTD